MTIKALFFDFGGVLLQFADGIDHPKFEAAFGLEERTLFRILYRDSRYMEYQVGGCTHEEWEGSIRTAAVAQLGAERAAEVMAGWQDAPRPLNEDLISLIERLRARGYRTGIISNTIPGMEDRLQRELPHLIPLFDVRIGSGDLKLAKPDPAIFHHALREMDVPAEAATFADDVKSYAEAASSIGMHGIHFTGYEQFVTDLRAVGVDA